MAEQKQFLDVIDRDEAEQRFHQALNLQPLSAETVPLEFALGRILAGNVISSQNVPSFDRSNYDGFAVLAADTVKADETHPVRLKQLPESIATAVVPACTVTSGTTIPIATGGMIPRGADAVLMVEHSELQDDHILVYRSLSSGFGISCAGTDITTGEIVLRKGQRLSSRETGVLAAIGEGIVSVVRKPKVAVISTGNEIIPPGAPMEAAMIYDSNARILADAIRELGGEPIFQGIIRDDLQALTDCLHQSISECDLILLSGGTSKGEGDLCSQVVGQLSDPGIVAHGVALKPGKPLCLAVTAGKAVVILPGFPTSAIFTFHEFVAPVIRQLCGATAKQTTTSNAQMAVRVNSEIGRQEFLLVGLVKSASSGNLVAYPMGKGSGNVTTFCNADGFVTIDRHREIIDTKETVPVTLLGRDLELADLVLIGSHCLGIDLLLSELNQHGFHIKMINVGSTAGLEAARRGECDIAGCHLLDPDSNNYNQPFLDNSLDLVKGYTRTQGIIYRIDDVRFHNKTLADVLTLITHDHSVQMVNRNAGSGTRILIDQLLKTSQPPGYTFMSRSHHAVATSIKHKNADWGVAIESVVDDQLGFLPLANEEFDFFIPLACRQKAAVKMFLEILESESFQAQLAEIGLMKT